MGALFWLLFGVVLCANNWSKAQMLMKNDWALLIHGIFVWLYLFLGNIMGTVMSLNKTIILYLGAIRCPN